MPDWVKQSCEVDGINFGVFAYENDEDNSSTGSLLERQSQLTKRLSIVSAVTSAQNKSEKEFFKLLFFSIVLNYPKIVVDQLLTKSMDVNEMYYKAKKVHQLKFN